MSRTLIAVTDSPFPSLDPALKALARVDPEIRMSKSASPDDILAVARRRPPVGRYVDRVQTLDIKTVAACHTPVIEGPFIERAFNRIREFPTLDAPMLPDQSVLEQIVATTSQPQS